MSATHTMLLHEAGRWHEVAPAAYERRVDMARACFETLGLRDGRAPLARLHLARLRRLLRRARTPWPCPADLLPRATAWSVAQGAGDAILRVAVGPVAGTTDAILWAVRVRPRASREPVTLLPVHAELPARGPLAVGKWEAARALYDDAHVAAGTAGCDDALLVDPAGRALETATANLWWWDGDRWHTPVADGRLLPGLGRRLLLRGLAALGAPAATPPAPPLAALAGRPLAVSNAVHGPRRARLEGVAPAPDAAAHALLARAWQTAVARHGDPRPPTAGSGDSG